MGIIETAIFYLLIGIVTGAAMFLREKESCSAVRWVLRVAAWPVFAPLLLSGPLRTPPISTAATAVTEIATGLSTDAASADLRLERAEQGLLAALAELDGVGKSALKQEMPRIRRLAASLRQLGRRLAEIDRLLATPEFDASRAAVLLAELSGRVTDRHDSRESSLRTRLRNIEKLQALRAHTAELLERSLLKLEELSSQVLLLRFAVDPEREVAELMRDIAASVEGLSEGLSAVA